MVAFQLLEEDTQNPHRFATYDCVASAGDLVDGLAERVRRLYVDPTELHDALAQAVRGLEDVADTERLQELLERSGERRVGNEGVSTCRYRGARYHSEKKQ